MTDLVHVGPIYVHYPSARCRARRSTGRGQCPQALPSREARRAGARMRSPRRHGRRWPAGAAAGLDGDRGLRHRPPLRRRLHFLLAGVWRGSNEAWEAVWYRDGAWRISRPSIRPIRPSAGASVRPSASGRWASSPMNRRPGRDFSLRRAAKPTWRTGKGTCSPGPSEPRRSAQRVERTQRVEPGSSYTPDEHRVAAGSALVTHSRRRPAPFSPRGAGW